MSQASTREAGILLALLDRVDLQDADQQNDLGVVLHRRGLTTSAIEAFATAAVADPTFLVARRNAMDALTERDGSQPRLEAWRAQAASDADAPAPWLALARLAFIRQDGAELATAAAAARRLGATESWVRWIELAAAFDVGDLDAAEQILSTADGDEPVVWRWRALLAYRRGDLGVARDLIGIAVARLPNDWETQLLRAFILGDLGDATAARQAYQAAVLLRPGLGRAEPHLAVDGSRGRPAPTASTLDGGMPHETVTAYAETRRTLGIAALAMGHTAVAERALESGFAGAPDVRGATALATIAMGRGDIAAAFGWFDRLVAEHPDDATLWNARGVAAHRLGRWPEAEMSYRRAVSLGPSDPIILGNLGVVLMQSGRTEEAVAAARRSAVAGGRAVRRNAAMLLAAAGVIEEAQALLGALLEEAPEAGDAPELWYASARLALAAGALDAARGAVERATMADPSLAAAWHLLAAVHEAAGDPFASAVATDRGLAAAPVVTAPGFELQTHQGAFTRRKG